MPNPKGHEDSIKDSRFKAAWQSGPTRTIRVPIALADATLEYARQLDRGIEPRDTWVKSDTQIHNKVDNIVTEPRDTAKIQVELESLRANYDALLETSTRITTKLRNEVHRLRSALELPEASVLLNKLKAKRKKSTASLADVDAILEILEES
ncbi:hypothetical protein Q5692_37265 [Microcoleus sp. C2C3]|uniref:hypothetical protein n=1 Tax=unclassified Microcoleus TaxID=2642155 RepID=UPI002FD35A13